MTTEPGSEIRDMDGLPRANGELLFEAPWESRAFGMAVALEAQGNFVWRQFRDALVDEIAAAESADDGSTYYERWLASLEKVLLDQQLVTTDEIEARHEEYESGLHDEDGHI